MGEGSTQVLTFHKRNIDILHKGKAREVAIEAWRRERFEPRITCESEELGTVGSLAAAEPGIAVLPELGTRNPMKTTVVKSISRRLIRSHSTAARLSLLAPQLRLGSRLLAIGADTEELQLVRHLSKATRPGDTLLPLTSKALFDFHYLITPRADQVMVMHGVVIAGQLESGRAITEIKPIDQLHLYQQFDGSVNGCQITRTAGHRSSNLPNRHGVWMSTQNIENGPSWTRNPPVVAAQFLFEHRCPDRC